METEFAKAAEPIAGSSERSDNKKGPRDFYRPRDPLSHLPSLRHRAETGQRPTVSASQPYQVWLAAFSEFSPNANRISPASPQAVQPPRGRRNGETLRPRKRQNEASM